MLLLDHPTSGLIEAADHLITPVGVEKVAVISA
jgi:hypothetical protein